MVHVMLVRGHALRTEIVLMDFAVDHETAKETSLALPQIGNLG